MGKVGTSIDKLLKSGDLCPPVTNITSSCTILPHMDNSPHRGSISFKLNSIRGLDRKSTGVEWWQSRCDRGGPTHERGHHEQRRRNHPNHRAFSCFHLLHSADAAGDQHL